MKRADVLRLIVGAAVVAGAQLPAAKVHALGGTPFSKGFRMANGIQFQEDLRLINGTIQLQAAFRLPFDT